MTTNAASITYTKTDEAPALASYALLPIVQAFAKSAGVSVETRDISLASRILAAFSDLLPESKRQPDELAALGELVKRPEANIVKLPNISASIPQLDAAIKELQGQGFDLPDFPRNPRNDKEQEAQNRYAKVLGSAVNPVLREGNSDRRVAESVKRFARKHPHPMGEWSSDSKTDVASMAEGDFYGSERSLALENSGSLSIVFEGEDGSQAVLRESVPVEAGDVVDAAFMDSQALKRFYEEQMQEAKRRGVLLSLHLKATMMKVSDPILFGYCVETYFRDVFEKRGQQLRDIGVDLRNGLGDVFAKIKSLPEAERREIESEIQAVYQRRPALAMVDSDRGITNLHVPSDVIIDASMPAAIRASGQMWGPDGELGDTLALIPDRSYAGIYREAIDFCKRHGAFDPSTMGSVSNVGLMAQKAEEYGSHDKTFRMEAPGTVKVVDEQGQALTEFAVQEGDIWRMCQTKDVAIRDWVELAVRRARETGAPAVFWLDENRPHDANLIAKVEEYLKHNDTSGLEIQTLSPVAAMRHALKRVKDGKDAISVTGNVLRDYLTDLFPILELGTSAKMLSIVPLLAGGGLYETGAGGSAPKHVQQFLKEGHLRWDSLGEYLALAVSLEELARKSENPKAKVLAKALDLANARYLEENKAPSRKVNEPDNRASSYYIALYWAQALAAQSADAELKAQFSQLAKKLEESETAILDELVACQGNPVDIGGYYYPDPKQADAAMRPSGALNQILGSL